MKKKTQPSSHTQAENASRKPGERIPLHRQITDVLRTEIESGKRPPYSELPSEQELAKRFETTRMTVRQAITALEIEGLIEKQQGRRTIVSPPKQLEPIFVLPHDNDDFFRRRDNIRYQLLLQDMVAPPKHIREELELPWTVDRILCVARVRILHNVPISWYETFVSSERASELREEDLTDRSLVQTMRSKYRLIPERMVHRIEVLSADERTSTLLDVKERSPLLKVESIEYAKNNVPFSHNVEYFRADRYRFQITLSNPQSQTPKD